MTTDQPNIATVARIRKLLNLAKDGAASEAEQELAAAHAQRLMLEHNVSIATVEAAQHDTATTHRRKKEATRGGAAYAWQQQLMGAVATANFCYVTTRHEWVKGKYRPWGYELVGREENTVGATIMFDYLRATTERLARDYVGGDHLRLMSREAMSFKVGCGERISQRVQRRHREQLAEQAAKAAEANAQHNTGQALVPIMADYAEAEECANEDFRLNLAPGTTAHRRFVADVKSKAWQAVAARLNQDDLKGVIDEAMLKQIASATATDILSASLAADELAEAVDYAIYPVKFHLEEHDPKKKAKAKKQRGGRTYRYRGISTRRTVDGAALNAGRSAGDNVGLDRQVATGTPTSNPLRLK